MFLRYFLIDVCTFLPLRPKFLKEWSENHFCPYLGYCGKRQAYEPHLKPTKSVSGGQGPVIFLAKFPGRDVRIWKSERQYPTSTHPHLKRPPLGRPCLHLPRSSYITARVIFLEDRSEAAPLLNPSVAPRVLRIESEYFSSLTISSLDCHCSHPHTRSPCASTEKSPPSCSRTLLRLFQNHSAHHSF